MKAIKVNLERRKEVFYLTMISPVHIITSTIDVSLLKITKIKNGQRPALILEIRKYIIFISNVTGII